MQTTITMTEGSAEDGNYLVLVRAQVMTRDDSSGGWVPMGGGGLSHVSVRKRILPADDVESKHEYVICGKRINDHVGVLSCTIKKDFEYNKVMPTFHHWRTGDKKYGLTFQTSADARAFDKGVRVAVEDLEGSLEIHDTDVGDDEVFMVSKWLSGHQAIDLPVERGDSQSSSGSSGGGCGVVGGSEMLQSAFTHPHANHHYFHRMHYITRSTTTPSMANPVRSSPTSNNNNKGVNSGGVIVPPPIIQQDHHNQRIKVIEHSDTNVKDIDKIEIMSEPYSYVQFARDRPSVHDYSYPMVDSVKSGGGGGGGGGGLGGVPNDKVKNIDTVTTQQQQIPPPPLLPIKSKWTSRHHHTRCGVDKKVRDKLKHHLLDRSRCKHCHEMFNEDENERGSCEYAPDPVRSCIGAVTCLSCAQCMLYHCMSDAEGDFASHPCSCDRTDGHCTRRWFGLAVLSIFVPCLWCYLPLSTCHRCGVEYGVCGARHEAS